MTTSANLNTDAIGSVYSDDASGSALAEVESSLGGAVVRELDEQIRMYSAGLAANNAQQQAVRADITRLNNVISGQTTTISADIYKKSGSENDFLSAGDYYVFGKNSREFAFLQEMAGAAGVVLEYGSYKGKVAVSREQINSLIEGLEGRLKDLNSVSEIKMINFQALMDARKQAMLMLSNMINADNQTKMAIIQNLKG